MSDSNKLKFTKYNNKNNTTMRDYSIFASTPGDAMCAFVVGNIDNTVLVPHNDFKVYEQPRTFSDTEAHAYVKYLNSLDLQYNGERIQLPV